MCRPVGCVIDYKYNIINNAYLIYFYVKRHKCENIYKEIGTFYNYLYSIDYLYTDIKKNHFIYNNNKLYIIDIDHHFKKNYYGPIKQNISRIKLIKTFPQLAKYIKIKPIYYLFFYINIYYIIFIMSYLLCHIYYIFYFLLREYSNFS